jgi:hypothetical protein
MSDCKRLGIAPQPFGFRGRSALVLVIAFGCLALTIGLLAKEPGNGSWLPVAGYPVVARGAGAGLGRLAVPTVPVAPVPRPPITDRRSRELPVIAAPTWIDREMVVVAPTWIDPDMVTLPESTRRMGMRGIRPLVPVTPFGPQRLTPFSPSSPR